MKRRSFNQALLGSVPLLAFPSVSEARLPTVNRKGIPYVPLTGVIQRYGFKRSFAGSQCTLKSRWSRLVFDLDTRVLIYNGLRLYMHGPFVKLTSKDWGISEVDLTKTLDPLLRHRNLLKGLNCRTILIDPGHGGTDTGARSKSGQLVLEKAAALDISRRLETRLTAKGMKPILTRTGDKTLGLYERAARAGVVKADLLVSIHLNSAGSKTAAGIETYAVTVPGQRSTHDTSGGSSALDKPHHGNRYDSANLVAAHAVQSALLAQTRAADRGVKRARFVVIREARCPALLVECGFLSNPGEARKLASSAYRDKLAEGLVHGILDYQRKVVAAG